MQIDIRTALRRLLCAGVPLLAAGCNANPLESQDAALAQRCTERLLPGASAQGTQGQLKASLVITPDDDRWADFYAACLEREQHCARLCNAALASSGLVPPNQGSSLVSCGISSCTEEGKPVLYLTYSTHSLAAVGRRPAGFQDPALAAGDPCGAWLARAAALEAASIPAFAQLARELVAHGAPPELVGRARAAMADEARHFRVTRQLARGYGADVQRPRASTGPVRPLLDMAVENIVEGCVNETFAALLALWQSQHAGNARVRAAMAGIAEDETRHAQLSWDVADFLLSRLAASEAEVVAAAFVDATTALRAAARAPVEPTLVKELGLPEAAASQALAVGLLQSLVPGAFAEASLASDA